MYNIEEISAIFDLCKTYHLIAANSNKPFNIYKSESLELQRLNIIEVIKDSKGKYTKITVKLNEKYIPLFKLIDSEINNIKEIDNSSYFDYCIGYD